MPSVFCCLNLQDIFYIKFDFAIFCVIIKNIKIMQIAQIMENLEEDSKVGKRVRGDKVSLIQEIIDALQQLLTWAVYDDGDKATGANWNARVGETIIGGLGRGEGGRFISATNITSMMNQLEKENISPEMFTSMQDLLEGKEVSAEVLEQLKAVGLATEDGKASAKAAQIITAMKTGDPDKLKATLKETGKGAGKGKGSKPPKPPKPTKDEITEKNINETGAKIIEQGRLTEQQLNALKMFANGETVDNSLMQELIEKGIVEVDQNGYFSFTGNGNVFYNALERADLRKALDSLNKAEGAVAERIQQEIDRGKTEAEEAERIAETKREFSKISGFNEVDDFIDFISGKEPKTDFSQYGITELDSSGNQITTAIGKRLASALSKGDLRAALDFFRSAVDKTKEESAKNFDDDCNDLCYGFKLLQNGYFLTWTTNAYQDRERETFALKSIEDYVSRNVDNEYKGTYQFWHIDGSDFGDIIWQGVAGKFLVEIGKFREDEVGRVFYKFFSDNPDGHKELAPIGWGTSHGFVYAKHDRDDGVYEWFDKQETTVLPLQEAANIYTAVEFMLGDKKMQLSDKQIDAVNRIGTEVGMPSLLEKILSVGKKKTEILDGAGIASKQIDTNGNVTEVKVNDVKEKFAESVKACAADLRKKMDGVLSEMEKEDSDKVAMVRQLAELVAQVTDEELRKQLEELVMAMTEMYKPTEDEVTEEETESTEEMPVEDASAEVKSVMVSDEVLESLSKALEFDKLSVLLEEHDKAIKETSESVKAFEPVVSAIQELVEKDKALVDMVESLKAEVEKLREKSVELEKEDEEKLAEKQVRNTPFWASRFQASKAAETVLDGKEEKKFSKPEVPSVIQSMSKKVFGGK